MKMHDIERALALFSELKTHLWNERDESLYHPYRNVCEAIDSLEADGSEAEKAEVVRTYCRLLFPARGGLSDFVIWDPDPEVRKARNAPLERIRKELFEIVNAEQQDKCDSIEPGIGER